MRVAKRRFYPTVILQCEVARCTAGPHLIEYGIHGDQKFDGNKANAQSKDSERHQRDFL